MAMQQYLGIAVSFSLAACAFDPSGAGDVSSNDGGFADAPAVSIDAAAPVPDASRSIDAARPDPDAPPPPAVDAAAPDARGDGIACGLLTCTATCCFTPPALFRCDLPTCTGVQRLCDGPEDCAPEQDCCLGTGGDTTCESSGSCDDEVCHVASTCTDEDHDDCHLSSGDPYPTCRDD
jgi:hypothetical protein